MMADFGGKMDREGPPPTTKCTGDPDAGQNPPESTAGGNPFFWTGRRRVAFASLVVGVVLMGIGLRAWRFHVPPLWTDEFASYWICEEESFDSVLKRNGGYSTTQPLYFLVLATSLRVFGHTEFAMRLPSLLFGSVFLVLFYLMLREVLDRAEALIGLLLAALNPLMVYYSREARPYGLCLLLTALSLWTFLRIANGKAGRGGWVAWLLSSAALFYTHGVFATVFVIENVLLFQWSWQDRVAARKVLWRWLAFQVLLVLIILPEMVNLVRTFLRREDINFGDRAPDVWQAMSFFFMPGLFIGMLAALVLCAAGGGVRELRFAPTARPEATEAFLWMFVVPTGLLLGLGAHQHMLFGLRYRLPAALGAFGLSTVLLTGWRPRLMRVTLLIVVVVCLAGQRVYELGTSGIVAPRHKEWEGVARLLRASNGRVENGDVMVVRSVLAEGERYHADSDPRWAEYVTCQVSRFYFEREVLRVALPLSWDADRLDRDVLMRLRSALAGRTRFWYFGHGDGFSRSFQSWVQTRLPGWTASEVGRDGNVFIVAFRCDPP